MSVEEQVVSIYAGTRGYLDDLPLGDVRRFEAELLQFFRARRPEILAHIRDRGDLPEDVEASLRAAIEEFKQSFNPSGG
jgi:F-type H+-transporting ATPase subunit alpha